jgi:hypothetical protein
MLVSHTIARAVLIAAFTTLAADTATAAGIDKAPAAPGFQTETSDPLTIVEEFLLARNIGDFAGAAILCAPLLELQDQDGQWFTDTPTTTAWLHHLSDKYLLENFNPLRVDGYHVSWTERLTQRGMALAGAPGTSFTLEVHAMIRDSRIAQLSAPYPPVSFRSPLEVKGEPINGASTTPTGAPPLVMFVGSALTLSLTALVAARGVPAVCGAIHRGSWREPDGSKRRSYFRR